MLEYKDDDVIDFDTDMTQDVEFCSHCCSDVKLDTFGMPACKQCNPQYDEEYVDEEGNLKEIDFRDME